MPLLEHDPENGNRLSERITLKQRDDLNPIPSNRITI